MANITIQTHNATVQATSGRSIFTLSLDGCTVLDAWASAGTMANNITVSLSRMGTDLILEWEANTSPAGRATLIVVEAQVDGSTTKIRDVMAFNQQGSQYNINVSGPRDVDGDMGSQTYNITSTINGTYGVYAESGWLDINTVTKTGSNQATAVITRDRNHSDPRYGVVRVLLSYQYNPYNTTYYMVLTQGTYVEKTSSLSYNPNTANVSYAAGTHTSPAATMENVGNLTVRNVSGDMAINSVDIDSASGKLVVSYGANNGSESKSATISVQGTGVSGNVSTTYYLYQGSYSYAVQPIWKTTVVEVSGRDYIDYTISTGGNVVYSGRAYRMPGEENINFELNEVVRDYVDNTLWWRSGYQTPSGWQRTFTLEMGNGDAGDYIFTKDWSYEELNYSSTPLICLNDPIINEVPEGCFVPVCVFSPQKVGDVSFVYTTTQGNTPLAYGAHLDNPRQARYLYVSRNGYKYGFEGGGISNRNVYKGIDACSTPYVLYYENAFGGIDALPIQGNVTATDKLTSYATKNAVRVPSTNFSYRRYLNEITKTWELKTRWLTDEQSSKMHHLIESTLVYLYETATGALYPVVIDDSSLTYKTFKNQQRKLFNYSFNVRESQNKIRK